MFKCFGSRTDGYKNDFQSTSREKTPQGKTDSYGRHDAHKSVVVLPFCQQPSGQSEGPSQAHVDRVISRRYGFRDLRWFAGLLRIYESKFWHACMQLPKAHHGIIYVLVTHGSTGAEYIMDSYLQIADYIAHLRPGYFQVTARSPGDAGMHSPRLHQAPMRPGDARMHTSRLQHAALVMQGCIATGYIRHLRPGDARMHTSRLQHAVAGMHRPRLHQAPLRPGDARVHTSRLQHAVLVMQGCIAPGYIRHLRPGDARMHTSRLH